MMKIFKYPVPLKDKFIINLPKLAHVLSFQLQNLEPMIWCAVHPENELIPYHFRLVGTGHEFNQSEVLKFVGTVQLHNGLVFHLFHAWESNNE